MKDRVFTGPDVPEALAAAASALGLPEAALRYVVLDAGSAGGRGLQPTPARVAVLLEETTPPPADAPEPWSPPLDARAGIRATVRALAEAARIDLSAEISEDDERIVVQLRGPDLAFFFEREGRGDVLRATEHLLQRTYGAGFLPRPLRVECEGFQERRDKALADQARRLAEGVRGDGRPRTTEPLNGYERRVVHLALHDEPGITTYSVGEGAARRVTVAPAGEPPPDSSEAGPGASPDE
jgi:spoIIIJ-associated protein